MIVSFLTQNMDERHFLVVVMAQKSFHHSVTLLNLRRLKQNSNEVSLWAYGHLAYVQPYPPHPPPPPPKVKWREDSLASVSPCGGRVRLQVGYWLPRCLGLFYGSQSREPKWRLINGVLLSMKIRILQAKTTKWLKATVNWNNTVNSYQSRRKLPKYKIKACKTNLT